MNKKVIKFAVFFVSAITTFLLDYFSKQSVLDYFHDKDVNYEQITSFFNLVLTFNTGVSFGMLNDPMYDQWIFIILTSAVIFVMFCWFIVSKDTNLAIPIGMIIGGAFGNVINRFTYGGVVDFLDFHLGLWHYPAFNIADAAICIGVFILIFFSAPSKAEIGKFA